MDNSPKVSVVLMIYNEESQIRDCLDTIKWADEIVVCDSFSTDRTVEICKGYTDKIYQRKFDNFGNQKNWTLEKPAYEWVLFVEGDERISPGLRDEIRERLAKDEGLDGYWVPYDNYFRNRKLMGDFWKDKRIKLFKKSKVKWQSKKVHAGLIFNGKAGELKNPVIHFAYLSFRHSFDKFNYSTTLSARERLENNVKLEWYRIIKEIVWVPVTFYRFYFKGGDWKSGLPGFIISLLAAPVNLVIVVKHLSIKIRNRQG